MSFLIAEWAKKDPDSALAWAKGLEDEKERAEALVSVLPGWQLKHPDQTLDEAADLSIIPNDRFRVLIGQVVGDLATADPSHAMEYSLSVEDSENQRIMVGMTVESWARKAPAQALQAVEALPAGALRDTGLSKLSPWIAQTSFDDARGLVREIGDAAIRQETIETMLIFSNALERHFPQALQLVDELPQVDHMAVHGWTNKITSENVPAFRTWLEEAKVAGKIRFPTHPNPGGVDPEELRKLNEASAAAAYGIILEALEQAPERK